MAIEIHFLTLAQNERLCLGCGNRFTEGSEPHDFAACHQKLAEEHAAVFPPYRVFPPDRD